MLLVRRSATASTSPLRDAEPQKSKLRLSVGYTLSRRPVTSGRIRLLHSAELFLPIFPIERGCPMLIPLGHENMEGRRWPVISIALVLLNVGIFLATRGQIHQENPQRTEVRAHLLILAATHPELSLPPNVEVLVTKFKSTNPGTWKEAQSETRDLADAWDARMRLMEDKAELQQEMDSLAQQWAALEKSGFLEQYAYVPAHPSAISYVTANFLHAGWLHLIGNMWLFWLAGPSLEDTLGRVIFSLLYLSALA